MNLKKFYFLLLSVLFLSVNNSFSQQEDAGLWTGIRFNYDLSDKWQLSFEEELRFHENVSRLDKFYSQVGLSLRASDHVEFGAFYRFENQQDNNSNYDNRHRFHFDFELKTETGRYTLSSRSRIQTRYTNPYSSDDGTIPTNYFRNKFGISYNVRRSTLNPYISYEFYYATNKSSGNEIDHTMFTLGFRFRLKNRDRVNMYYRISQELNVNDPIKLNIFGISLTSKLNRNRGQ